MQSRNVLPRAGHGGIPRTYLEPDTEFAEPGRSLENAMLFKERHTERSTPFTVTINLRRPFARHLRGQTS